MVLQDKINEKTNNIYKGFIVKKAEYNIAKNLLSIVLVFPEKFYKHITSQDRDVLKKTITEIVGEDIQNRIQIEYSFADSYVIKNTVCKFIAKEEPLYANNIAVEDIVVVAKSDTINVSIKLDSGTYGFFTGNDFVSKLTSYLNRQYTQDVYAKLSLDASKDVKVDSEQFVTSNIFSSRGTRTMVISEQSKLMGRAFLGAPSYICDLKDNPKEQVVACGKVSRIYTNYIEKIGKTKVSFMLNDTTGSINVVKFDKSKNEEYKNLEEGMEVVVQGKASINTYNDRLQMIVNNVATCKIDYSAIDLEPVYNQANLYYLNVFPEEYVEYSQTNLFEQIKEVPSFVKDKTFIAFDLETTGLTAGDKIVEIGACKMVNGEITEVFNSLVNPEMHISESATKVNNITDDDVRNAKLIEDVFPDFYKFIEDFPLVAHNIEFDIGFINKVAKSMNYKVSNEQFDTLVLAKKYLKLPKYKLNDVCSHYGIINVDAHRACSDAVACMKVFKELAIYMDN